MKVFALAALLAASGAHAALQDVAGANYSLDTGSGLRWLDVSATVGLSYNQVTNSSLFSEGWRYATGAEVRDLFASNLGFSEGAYSADVQGAVSFAALLGGPTGEFFGQGGTGGPFIYGLTGDAKGAGHELAYLQTGYQAATYNFGDSLADAATFAGGIGYTGGSGSFLVSPVPEPSTYAMFGLGLAMVGWVARRRAS